LQVVALAISGIYRTYGARHCPMSCTQCSRTGLQSSAPPALRCQLWAAR